MFTLRPTQKLFRRVDLLAAQAVSTPDEATTTRLGDWYANLLTLDRRPIALFVSERTLLPVLVHMAPSSTLAARFREAVAEMMIAIGISDADVRDELREMGRFAIGKTTSRRILGSMNDFGWLAEGTPAGESLLNAALVLADAPCSPIAMRSPREATLAAFEVEPAPLH